MSLIRDDLFCNIWLCQKNTNPIEIIKAYLPDINIAIELNTNKKPYIKYPKDSKIFFNKSHSQDITLLAIANKEVGLDIEKIKNRKFAQDISKKYNFREDNFYISWTLREAFIKSKGQKLSNYLNRITVKKITDNEYLLGLDKSLSHKALSFLLLNDFAMSLSWPF